MYSIKTQSAVLFQRCLGWATPTPESIWRSHLLFQRSHLLFQRSHLLFQRSHLLFQRSHLLIWRSQLLFRGSQLLFRGSHLFILYYDILEEQGSDRILYLAIPHQTYTELRS
ncbi:hypothetical protein OGM63_19875 [Plectonema radiosum NIES-515]|uniref:Uncharacterized protein n=1 Tax=Plectonema radiosum NIES-515 TaxID=2986073 RepID=A0ABT3B3C9_9CYAN|nr:hypothetical protein [Plectonema radiosum]MCV3215740.1 hypothetical protein [Plectonema radiosum NIES-515]